MIVALGVVLGVVLGVLAQPTIPPYLQPYLPIAVVAALDAMFGGLRAHLDGVFSDRVFISSFIFNVLIASFIVFLGEQLGVGSQMTTAVVVVLGIRIFANAAAIRRHIFKA
ncbi:MAG TPA: small basic family protein [Actinomycetaceae bacterium]|nr:small basic family protein [Actinomycetaceae bacterium]